MGAAMAFSISYFVTPVGGDASGDFQTNTFETGAQLAPDVLGLSGGGSSAPTTTQASPTARSR